MAIRGRVGLVTIKGLSQSEGEGRPGDLVDRGGGLYVTEGRWNVGRSNQPIEVPKD